MKYLFLVIALFIGPVCMAHSDENFIKSDLFGNLGERDKAAILIIHFGTTHDDTRVLTIDAINAKMKEAFPGIEVREAWTSRIILKKLKERGVERLNPTQALIQLHEQGYTHILIQSTNIIEGTEMKELRREVEGLSLNFKDIRVGNPLLYAPEDYAVVVKAITEAMNQADRGGQKLLVGHGTPDPATASYAMFDYMLKAEGHPEYHVGTVEGYPEYEDALRLLKNEELIALNQDVLGLQAYVVKQMDGVYILTKDLEEVNGNTCAVAVYNSTDEERTIHLDFADFYLRGDVSVRDLFERRDLGKYKDRDFSVTIPAHGTRIFRLDGLERGERTIYEAECAWLQDYQEIRNHKAFETAIYEDDGNCSGGAKVTGLGNRDSNYLEWHNVYSREGGLYLMSVDYQCAENRELICQVNGVVVKNVEAHPAHEVASEQIEIRLKPGMNRIRLSNGNSWMPDIDRMVLQKK